MQTIPMGASVTRPVAENDRISYVSSSTTYLRANNIDAHAAVPDLDDLTSLLGVYDGHGDEELALFCAKQFHTELHNNQDYEDSGFLPDAMQSVFFRMDELLKLSEINKFLSTVAIKSKEERIQAAGRQVTRDKMCIQEDGYSREKLVLDTRVNGILTISRAIGDFAFKQNKDLTPEQQMVTCEPSVQNFSITNDVEFLVIASEGIWFCIDSQTLANIVGHYTRCVFMRHFITSELAYYLIKRGHLQFKNFLIEVVGLKSLERMFDLVKLDQPIMGHKTEVLSSDFGEIAIERVAPVNSGLCCIILLYLYMKWIGDSQQAESPNYQWPMHPSEGCDTSPASLCADGYSTREQGIYGYPSEIQVLSCMAMRCFLSLLKQGSDGECVKRITKRIHDLGGLLNSYCCLELQRINDTYLYDTEQYLLKALDKINVINKSILDWLFDILNCNGYFIGQPTRTAAEVNKSEGAALAVPNNDQVLIDTIDEMDVSNRFTICLDKVDEEDHGCLANIQSAIAAIRAWCFKYGLRFQLSACHGFHYPIFTTPQGGTFYLTLKHKERSLILLFSGGNLYFRGWRGGINGSFEIKPAGYMLGDVRTLPIECNYGFLSPNRDVGETRMGPEALRESFEILYKCNGDRLFEVKQAIGTIAVHFAEGARLQCVYKAIRASFLTYTQPTLDYATKMSSTSTLDIKRKNSYRVRNYKKCCKSSLMDPGQNVNHIGGDTVSSIEIFTKVRVMLRSSCEKSKNEKKPLDIEDPDDQYNKLMVSKSGTKPKGAGQKRKSKGLEEISVGEANKGSLFHYLLKDWLPANEIDHEREEEEEDDDDDHQPPGVETAHEEFLNHFVSVRNFVEKRQIQKFEGCKISNGWERRCMERFEMAAKEYALSSSCRKLPVIRPSSRGYRTLPSQVS